MPAHALPLERLIFCENNMSKIALCQTTDVPQDEMKLVKVQDKSVLVYNLDGEYFATDDACTHAEASLSDGWIEDGDIVCPFHDGKFSIRTGEATAPPCIMPLKTYTVSVEEGTIFAELD